MIKTTRKEFEQMYYSMPVKKMAKKLKVSTTTLYTIIKEMKIKKKGKKEKYKKIIVEE